VVEFKQVTALPQRFACRNCGMQSSEALQSSNQDHLRCRGCGNALSETDFFPEEKIDVPVITEHEEVPNGMVAMTLYSALMVDAAPYAKNLRETPILNVDEEVDIASLRASYPKQWDALRTALGPMLAEAQNRPMARQK